MKKLKGLMTMLIITGVFCSGFSLYGRKQQEMVKYTSDFRFADGIFLDFYSARNNKPVPKNRIVTALDYNSSDFFKKLFENKTISYYDTSGVKKEVIKEDLWGYADKGIIYIQIMGGFSPFTFMGKICHVIAEIKFIDTINYDPAYRRNIYPYDSYGYPLRYYDPYYNRYYYYSRKQNDTKSEQEPGMQLNQYLFDFETGELWEYDVPGVKELIKNDSVLYREFDKLRNSTKKKLMFSYIRKYNERNPLYIPAACSN
jgi:hypothetical protein